MEAAPDMFGMSDAQIEKVPPYVQYLKCEEKVESGDPGCKDNKFNLTMCEKVRTISTCTHYIILDYLFFLQCKLISNNCICFSPMHLSEKQKLPGIQDGSIMPWLVINWL